MGFKLYFEQIFVFWIFPVELFTKKNQVTSSKVFWAVKLSAELDWKEQTWRSDGKLFSFCKKKNCHRHKKNS